MVPAGASRESLTPIPELENGLSQEETFESPREPTGQAFYSFIKSTNERKASIRAFALG